LAGLRAVNWPTCCSRSSWPGGWRARGLPPTQSILGWSQPAC
jgi:hypothetical protein